MSRIRFFSGKGGVGKTTVAAAIASNLSDEGNVLLVSTDPAHNLSDLLRINAGPQIAKVDTNLDLLELDAEQEAVKYLGEIKENLKDKVKPGLIEEVYRHIDLARYSPGANESALFDRICRLILEEGAQYDYVLFDTAPTGHTLRLMTLPELMGIWVDGLIGKRKALDDNKPQWVRDAQKTEDPVLEKLNERKARFSRVREYLQDPKQTQFWFIANPDRLSVLETKRSLTDLSDNNIPLGGLIINKTLESGTEDDFFSRRAKSQQPYLQELRMIKHVEGIYEIPLMDRDIDNEESFNKVRDFLK